MDEIHKLLSDLNTCYFEDSHEIQVMDRASWRIARKRLGKATYLTLNGAYYETKSACFTLIPPKGVQLYA